MQRARLGVAGIVNTLAVLQVLGIVVPLLTAVIGDGIKTRTDLGVLRERVKVLGAQQEEDRRRQARHERDPVHAVMRGRR